MYFITNKALLQSGNKYIFQDSNEISQSLRYCRMINKKKFNEIKSKPFMKSLMEADEKEILFYIHGFNNQPYEDVFPMAAAMQKQLIEGG